MRILRDARGRFYEAPTPLEVAPGRVVWERYRNCEYVVFVDESFYRFFGFDNPDGNFCHAAVGVPAENYVALQRELDPVLQQYNRKILELSGAAPAEVKFTALRTLPLRFQARFAQEITRALESQGGFVSGFFTPTRGFIMERVRTGLDDGVAEVPHDHQVLYDTARQKLVAELGGPGQADLITGLIGLPISAIKFMLGSFDCTFRIQYDPREDEEDRVMRGMIANDMNAMLNVPEEGWQNDNYRGMDASRRSEDELGLQLADVIAGYVRDFFRNNRLALTAGSTPRLITPTSHEPLQVFQELNGKLFKYASLQRMPPGIRRLLAQRNLANLLSYFYPVLAGGILTCTTLNGQMRHLELPTSLIFDLLD